MFKLIDHIGRWWAGWEGRELARQRQMMLEDAMERDREDSKRTGWMMPGALEREREAMRTMPFPDTLSGKPLGPVGDYACQHPPWFQN